LKQNKTLHVPWALTSNSSGLCPNGGIYRFFFFFFFLLLLLLLLFPQKTTIFSGISVLFDNSEDSCNAEIRVSNICYTELIYEMVTQDVPVFHYFILTGTPRYFDELGVYPANT
jgi:hypothetical protein